MSRGEETRVRRKARAEEMTEAAAPGWSNAVELTTLETAGASTRGSGWVSSGSASSWECRAAQSRLARTEEAQEPSWGAAKAAL
eukprot:scaffold28150_cov60-Phaeocystis_antarctica.AAC.2